MMRLILMLLALAAFARPTFAQPADAALRGQAERLVGLLQGRGEPTSLFSAAFLAQIPVERMRAIAAQLDAQYGTPRGLAGVDARSPMAGTIRIDYERAVVAIDVQIAPAPPHLINGLLVTIEVRDDDIARVLAELRALPGQAGFAIARLGDGAPTLVHQP